MIRVSKIKTNPNLKGEEFIDDTFIDLLYRAALFIKISKRDDTDLAHAKNYIYEALAYKNIGKKGRCKDCYKSWKNCQCFIQDDYHIAEIDSAKELNSYLLNIINKFLPKDEARIVINNINKLKIH